MKYLGDIPFWLRLYCAGFIAACCVVLLPGTAEPQSLTIDFNTSPGVHELHAGGEPATMALHVLRADGQPVEQGWVEVQLDAPAPGFFFSTDFPLVEGSRLLTFRLPLSDGKTEWQYLFPIRGDYRLSVQAQSADGAGSAAVFGFTVKEKRTKWLAFGGFTLALFALGFTAGRVFTSRQAAALIFACALLDIWPPPGASAAGASEHGRLEVGEARVGQPTPVRWVPEPRFGHYEPNIADFSLTITHLEKEKTVFAIANIPVLSEYRMDFHFTDGAEHRLSARVETQDGKLFEAEKEIPVFAGEAPVKAALPALVFFVSVMALGIGAGRWSKKARQARRRPVRSV
jgi:hypothetical protein